MNQTAYPASIISLLHCLAVLDRDVGPIELCCMWFDDLYRQGEKCPDQYNDEIWTRGVGEWEAGLTERELDVLAKFRRLFQTESDALPVDWPNWDRHPGWQRVKEAR